MLRSINDLSSFTIHATDGDIGRCQDFLFDDRSWVVRFLVAKTAKWLPSRKVVISPVFLDQPDWVNSQFRVRLTREQIKQSPPLDEHAPVSRQYEIGYHQYYALPYYWTGPDLWGVYPDPNGVIYPIPEHPNLEEEEEEESETQEDHLRSADEVTGYHIAAVDGEIGHVDDFLVDDITWALRYMVVDTRNWLPGRKVLVSPQWLESIDWVDEKVAVSLDKNAVKNSPEFDPLEAIKRQYEIDLYNHYDLPKYWE